MNFIKPILNWLGRRSTNITSIATAQEVQTSTASPIAESFQSRADLLLLIKQNINQFLFWGVTSVTIITVVLMVSLVRKFEEWLDPVLHRIKKFAPFIMQITLGVALVLSAYYGNLFDVDLPLIQVFGSYALIAKWALYVTGIMLLLGIFPRIAGFMAVLFFIPILPDHSWQTLHHATYLGEGLTIFLLGGTYQLVKSNLHPFVTLQRSLQFHLHKYKFALLRIAFGLSVIYASFYTKYFHSTQALSAITKNNFTASLGFDPHFLLLGILIIELVLGLFFIIGFEIRFAAICYIALVLLSVTILQEMAWSHIALIGTSLAMFTHGYDRYTIGGRFFKRGNLEPIL